MVTLIRRPSRRDAAFLKYADHARLWNLVEGAVVDAFASHPDFLTDRGRKTVVRSVTKRVVGQVVGYAKQTLRGGRFGDCSRKGSNKAPDSSIPVAEAGNEGGDQTPPDRPRLPEEPRPSGRRSKGIRRKVGKGMFPWPASGTDAKGRAALRLFIAKIGGRFDSFHKGEDDLLFVKVRQIKGVRDNGL